MTPPEAVLGLRFRVEHADGRVEQLVVDAERALIGSAAHCEVRLPPEVAAAEHVEVMISNGQVHVAARVAERPPMLDGAPLRTGVWAPRSVLAVGGSRLAVDIVDLADRRRGRSPFWLFAPVPVVALVVTYFMARPSAAKEPWVPEAPPLFDAPITTCPMPADDQLRAFANEKLRVALARRERGPFSRADAVEAVGLFEVAAACFATAKLPDDEREASRAATTLRKKLEEEYHVRRVRLEHAFRVGDPVGARRELIVLIPMTSKRTGKYVDWLATVDRYARLEIESRTPGKLR